eukprot:TRINITY_DN1504_c0_g1_i11.p1 TRINITY_DN1504_c0_g1~~TRINITY_DN1504_c0_g1_i11.p1  ORF type:complete len:214 (+),score=52.46 TRINITY_DN1504_c0_g1_i11:214-855(+)
MGTRLRMEAAKIKATPAPSRAGSMLQVWEWDSTDGHTMAGALRAVCWRLNSASASDSQDEVGIHRLHQMIEEQHLAKDLEEQIEKQEEKLALQQGQSEDWGLTQHCISNNGECWSATGLTKIRLKTMCGISGGNGYEVKNGGCKKQGYTCSIKGGFHVASVGMGFYRRPYNGRCPESSLLEAEQQIEKQEEKLALQQGQGTAMMKLASNVFIR